MKTKRISIIVLIVVCCLSWPGSPILAQESEKPATMKCLTTGCTAENGFTDEMITQFKTKDGNWEHDRLTLNNVSNEDLKKLPALNDKLKTLTFWNKSENVTDIAPLAQLTNLTKLQLRELVNLTDISPIAGLKNLEWLDLYNLRQLTDLTPMGKLAGLKKLSLVLLGEPIDLSPVSNLVNLQELSIAQSVKYTSFDFLEPLNNLEKLAFVAEPQDVTDISALAGKTKLKELGFTMANITDISVLKDSTELERLSLGGTKVGDISVLKGLKKLKTLNLSSIPAKDLSPIGELSELTSIDLSGTNFDDYSPLGKCTKLEGISADRESSGFDNLEVLQSLPNVKYLNVDDNKSIQQWDALASLKSLETLDVSGTSFSDLSLLKDMIHLKTLNIQECTVTHPEAIATLPRLKSLKVKEAQGIEDISIFKNLAQIGNFYLTPGKEQFPQEQVDVINQAKDAAKKLQKIFEDKFKNNKNEWAEGENENSMLKVEDGKYVFEHKREEGSWMTGKSIEIDPQKDFLIEVTMSKVDGVDERGYGLVWGVKNASNYYFFGITGNGFYAAGKSSEGKWTDTIKWTSSPFINNGNATNKVSVWKMGDRVKFYVNDRYVAETAFEEFFDKKVGVVVYHKMKVEFEHILVKN